MQTFLPLPDFHQTVMCLDWRRLGKQRVEALQILNTLHTPNRWSHHPAVLMWKGHENALTQYMCLCIEEWKRRGYNNNMEQPSFGKVVLPPWFGQEDFHASHRSNLLRKDPEWYGQFGWEEPDSLPYIWPVRYCLVNGRE